MSDFVAAKTFTFAPRKNIYFSVQQKIMFLRPAKKNLPPRHKNFCVPPQNLRAKTRKTAQTGLRITPQKCGIARKKNFAPQTAQFARKQKFPKMETLPIGGSYLHLYALQKR